MVNRSRPVCALAVAPLLLVLLSGCSGTPAEAAPLNVAAINGIKAYRAKVVEKIHVEDGSLTLNLVQDVLAPDRERTTVSSHVNGQNISAESIAVGDQIWLNTGAGWRAQSIDASFRQATTNASMQICTAFRDLPARAESFHGQRAAHYSTQGVSTAALDAGFNQLAAALSALGAGTAGARFEVLSADLWTTADGAQPLRLKLKATTTVNGRQGTVDAQEDFSDIDGSDIEIEPPV
jgi:hypothetical protein